MITKDIVSNCKKLDAEIQQNRSNERHFETQKHQVDSEIQRLENAKIATRLEFGSATDLATVKVRENALNEINNSIRARELEKLKVVMELDSIKTQLTNLQSTYHSLGCRNII